jgi:PadR family transcriptional regulator PadR
MADLRMTLAVATVLRAFLEDESTPHYGYDLMRATGFPSGKIYPILARLRRAGLLHRELEDIDPAAEGRPRRALYRLTPAGVTTARAELAVLSERIRPPQRSAPRPSGLIGDPA